MVALPYVSFIIAPTSFSSSCCKYVKIYDADCKVFNSCSNNEWLDSAQLAICPQDNYIIISTKQPLSILSLDHSMTLVAAVDGSYATRYYKTHQLLKTSYISIDLLRDRDLIRCTLLSLHYFIYKMGKFASMSMKGLK